MDNLESGTSALEQSLKKAASFGVQTVEQNLNLKIERLKTQLKECEELREIFQKEPNLKRVLDLLRNNSIF